jgi:alpha-mannosidase
MQSTNPSDPITATVQAKLDAILAASSIPAWRFHIGASEGAMVPAFDDSAWESIKLPHTWSSAEGEAWFRATIHPPEAIEGIPLAGSRVELIIFLALGATIYLNGREVRRERSWTDSRAVALTLLVSYQPGSSLTIAVRANAGDGFGAFIGAGLRFSTVADAAFELDLARTQMTFTHFLAHKPSASPRAKGAAARRATWKRAAAALDLDALAANDWTKWRASVEAARVDLVPFAEEAKTYTAHLIAHSHIDMNWLWPWRETVEVCQRDFASVDSLMGRYPEFYFSQSQAATYQAMEAGDPPLFERMRARVKEGRWDITATNWVEGDLNLAAGESLVRQALHTRRYIADRFGVEPIICWEPDTFGHTANYPQILKKCGIQFYYFCRAGKRQPLFWWEGIDGSRVLAVQDPRGYGGENEPASVVGAVLDFAGRYGIHSGLYVYGAGDHGGGATARDIENARRIDAAPFVPHALPSATPTFYQNALAEAVDLPVVRGELNTIFEGCYSSHDDIKRMNRDGENGLLTAETIATVASLLVGADYPAAELAKSWRTLCFHQFHDILCGCAIGVTYREAEDRMSQVMATAQRVAANALAALAAQVDTGSGDGLRIVVFNPLAWERDDVVRVPLAQLGSRAPSAVEDDTGKRLPAQVAGDALIFVAEKVPALGMRVYRFSTGAGKKSEQAAAIAGEDGALTNGILRLRVHPTSGALAELVDEEAGLDLVGPWAGWGPEAKINAGMINRLQILWEQPHPMSAWNIGDITRVDHLITGASLRVVENGPVRGVVEVRRAFLKSSLVQRVILYRGLRRIDFETEVDWHERGSAHADAPMLRATFAPFLGPTTATFEVAFAGIERAADGREVPALRWADVSEGTEGGYGVSLLNDGKYGHQAHGNTLGLTLVRASYEPDNNPDEGLHRFTYALYPHRGTWKEAGTAQRAAELNQPLLALVTDGHGGEIAPGQPTLECEGAGVMVSALKMAEDQTEGKRSVIVRAYELHGAAAEATLRPGWQMTRAEEVDLVERPLARVSIARKALHLAWAPHEIKTVRISG